MKEGDRHLPQPGRKVCGKQCSRPCQHLHMEHRLGSQVSWGTDPQFLGRMHEAVHA